MGSISLRNLLGRGVSFRKWSRSLLLAGTVLGGFEAMATEVSANEPISTTQPDLADVIQPIGLRHMFMRPRGYCDDCVPCQPGMSGEEIAPGTPSTEQEMPDYSQAESEPASSNFGFANMLGDSPFGGCVTINSGKLAINMEHPQFACERQNVAENNSAIPADRVFFTYRRFINATHVSIYDGATFSSGPFSGGSSVLDVDIYTLGFEKKMLCDRASFEMRLPFTYQIGNVFDIDADSTNNNPNFLSGLPITEREMSLGNVSFIFKGILREGPKGIISGGVGLGLPTAKGVSLTTHLRDTNFQFDYFSGGFVTSDIDLAINTTVSNEIVNLAPFLAFAYAPNQRVFHQGFAQIDVPLNETNVHFSDIGEVTSTFPDQSTQTATLTPGNANFDIAMSQQTIARLNYQFGYWFFRDECAQRLRGLAGLFELHYTTTLNNARGSSIILNHLNSDAQQFITALGGDPNEDFTLLSVKNTANRVDSLNLALGLAARYGMTDIQLGYVMPLSDGDNKPFDGEFHVLANRNF